MNLCFAIGASLKHFQHIPLDRVGTHVLENYFGFIRLASKNKHTVPMMFTQAARGMILQQNIKKLNVEYFHKKRENSAGVQPRDDMEKFNFFKDIDTQLLFNDIIDSPCFSTTVKKAFQEYHEQVIETDDYPIIYYPDNFSSRQASQRIKNLKEEIVHDETEMRMAIPPFEANTQMAVPIQKSSCIYIPRSPTNHFSGSQPPAMNFTASQSPAMHFSGYQSPAMNFSGYQSPAMNFPTSQPLLYSPTRKHSTMMPTSQNDDYNQSLPPFF